MRIDPGGRIALDTNILLDATDESRPWHPLARSVFHTLSLIKAQPILGTQVIREYLVVATRPEKHNGLGLGIQEAAGNIAEFCKRASLVGETPASSSLFCRWAVQFQVVGKKLHDLQLLATIHQAGIRTLLTSNPGDFPPNAGVSIVTLADFQFP